MQQNQRISFVLTLCLIGLGLSIQACQQTSANSSAETQTDRQQSGAGRSGPLSKEIDKLSKPESSSPTPDKGEIREITYIAEKITPAPAQIASKDPTSRINVRSQPSTRSKTKHFGYKGDAVTLLQKAKGEGDAIWYYLRFDQSQAEGWIREDFITLSSSKLRPKQQYLSFNLKTDPWISSFNQSHEAAKQTNEPWLFNAPTVALKLLGYPNTDGCKPTNVSTIEHSPSNVTVIISNGPEQVLPCAGDSVLASETRVDLVKQERIWAIEWVGGRYRCHQGRGQQEFAPARCN